MSTRFAHTYTSLILEGFGADINLNLEILTRVCTGVPEAFSHFSKILPNIADVKSRL